jgi:hypothetical protein
VTGRRGRICKQLLDNLKEMTRYWKLKEETLFRTVGRKRFGRGYGPVVRKTTEWWWLLWQLKIASVKASGPIHTRHVTLMSVFTICHAKVYNSLCLIPEFLSFINLFFTIQLSNILTTKLDLINMYKMRAFLHFQVTENNLLHNERYNNCP